MIRFIKCREIVESEGQVTQVRMDTEMALDRIIQTVREEDLFPLRVLVLGEYEGLVYTERIYTTSKDDELKAAALVPIVK